MIFLSEYDYGDRTAHIFRRDKEYIVEFFEKLTRLRSEVFYSQQQAEDRAEDWVLNQ